MVMKEDEKKQTTSFVKIIGIIAIILIVALLGFRLGYSRGMHQMALVIETEFAKESAVCENKGQTLTLNPVLTQTRSIYDLHASCKTCQ